MTTEAIAQVARAIVEEGGLRGLNVKAVADRLGIRPPSLYAHVEGTEDLHRLLLASVVQELSDRQTSAAVGRSGTEALLEMAGAYRAFARQHPSLYDGLLAIPSIFPQTRFPESEAFLNSLYRVLSPLLPDRRQQVLFARGFRSLLHGFCALERAGYFQAGLETDAFAYTLQNFISDFVSRESGGPRS